MTHAKVELPETITSVWLIALGARRDCEHLRTFDRTFGGSCAPTRENLLKAAVAGLDVEWLARRLLAYPDYQDFDKARDLACKAYEDARDPALKAWQAAENADDLAAAWKAFAVDRARAWKAFAVARARALADVLWPPETDPDAGEMP